MLTHGQVFFFCMTVLPILFELRSKKKEFIPVYVYQSSILLLQKMYGQTNATGNYHFVR